MNKKIKVKSAVLVAVLVLGLVISFSQVKAAMDDTDIDKIVAGIVQGLRGGDEETLGAAGDNLIESYLPYVNYNGGINTALPVTLPDILISGTDGYINFSTIEGTSGYGLRNSSGTMQYKNNGGSWAGLGCTAIAGGGWVADATNNHMYATVNASGDYYPIVLGTNATSSPADYTTELYVGGGGGIVVTATSTLNGIAIDSTAFTVQNTTGNISTTGTLAVTGASTLTGTVTMAGAATIGTTLTVTGAATLSSTLAVVGASTFTDLATFNGDIVVESAIDTAAAGVLNIGTTTATSIEIADTGITTNVQGPLTAAETLNVTGASTLVGAVGITGAATLASTLAADNTTINGSLTANEASESVDFRVESNGDEYALIVDGSTDMVGISTSTPGWELSVVGTSAQLALAYDANGYTTFSVDTSDDLTILPSGGDTTVTGTLTSSGTMTSTGTLTASAAAVVTSNLTVDTNTLIVNATTNRVGIGTTTPSLALSVTSTSEQAMFAYDGSNYTIFSVSSGGDLTIDASGNDILTPDGLSIGTSTVSSYALDVLGDVRFGEAGNSSTLIVDATGAITASSTLTVSNTVTLSDTLTVVGDATFDTKTLFVDASANLVGVGTTTPANTFEVHAATGTTTISALAETASVGGNIILEDIDGAGCTQIYVLNGTITGATVTCPSN